MRQLKHHEQKLLRKVSLYQWKGDDNIRVAKLLRRYHIQNREDYTSYTHICGQVTKLTNKLKTLPPNDSFRIAMTDQLLDKLYNLGILSTTKSLKKAEEITASSIMRRRLPIVMVRLQMAQTPKMAITFIEQGQIRVGPNVITDPAFLVTRNMEDFVTWVDDSKVNRTVKKYNDKLDDFDMM